MIERNEPPKFEALRKSSLPEACLAVALKAVSVKFTIEACGVITIIVTFKLPYSS